MVLLLFHFMYLFFSNDALKFNSWSMTDVFFHINIESTDSTVIIYNTAESCTKTQPVLCSTSSL